jgi:hypothetical protein
LRPFSGILRGLNIRKRPFLGPENGFLGPKMCFYAQECVSDKNRKNRSESIFDPGSPFLRPFSGIPRGPKIRKTPFLGPKNVFLGPEMCFYPQKCVSDKNRKNRSESIFDPGSPFLRSFFTVLRGPKTRKNDFHPKIFTKLFIIHQDSAAHQV